MPLDTGDTSFMLVATALVMIMTPGLAFFYGGLVSKNNVLTIMMQSYVSMGVTTILWVTVGYSLCFSGGAGGIIGNLDLMFLKGGVGVQHLDRLAGHQPRTVVNDGGKCCSVVITAGGQDNIFRRINQLGVKTKTCLPRSTGKLSYTKNRRVCRRFPYSLQSAI